MWIVKSCYLATYVRDLHADNRYLVLLCSGSALNMRQCFVMHVGLVGATFCDTLFVTRVPSCTRLEFNIWYFQRAPKGKRTVTGKNRNRFQQRCHEQLSEAANCKGSM
jgi:hypothetical protein